MKKLFTMALAGVMCLGLSLPAFAADLSKELPSHSHPEIVYHLSKAPVGTITVDQGEDFGGPVTVYELEEGTVISCPGRTLEGNHFLMYSNAFIDGYNDQCIEGDELVITEKHLPRWAEEGVFNSYQIASVAAQQPIPPQTGGTGGGLGRDVDYAFWVVLAEPERPDTGVNIAPWAQPYVEQATEKNLVSADKLGKDYTLPITRSQFASLAVNVYREATGTTPTCQSDVFADGTNQDMAIMYELGVISGYNKADTQAEVKVGMNDPLTRAQAAAILTRLADVIHKPLTPAPYFPFKDAATSWAKDSISKVYGAGIMNGYNDITFGVNDKYTIQQSIVTMLRLYEFH